MVILAKIILSTLSTTALLVLVLIDEGAFGSTANPVIPIHIPSESITLVTIRQGSELKMIHTIFPPGALLQCHTLGQYGLQVAELHGGLGGYACWTDEDIERMAE